MEKFVRLEPALVPKIWGGTRLGAPIDGVNVGESWILSARREAESIVATGVDSGMRLSDWLERLGPASTGSNCSVMDVFPTLVKFIDAAEPLSIQVHPDDAYAHAHGEPYGKTEMWVILAADPGSFLYLGLGERMAPDEFATSIAAGTIEGRLNKVPVRPGDVFFIHAGLLHAIGAGILLAEVQQSSDTTYRVYDFGRVGADGRPRELHVQNAKEVASLEPPTGFGPSGQPVPVKGGTRQVLGQGTCFATERIVCDGTVSLGVTPESYVAVVVLNGGGTMGMGSQSERVETGQTWFVPAQDAVLSFEGKATLLRISVPDASGRIS